MNKKIKSIFITTLTLTLICVVSAAALALTNALTSDIIAESEVKAENEAMRRVIVADSYESNEITYGTQTYKYNKAIVNGQTSGYIFTVSSHGYGGDVKVMVGVSDKGKIVAIEIIDASSETPGLGQRVYNNEFTEQFKGKQKDITLSEGGGNSIDGLTGATISSKAVLNSVNTALEVYSAIIEEGGKNG